MWQRKEAAALLTATEVSKHVASCLFCLLPRKYPNMLHHVRFVYCQVSKNAASCGFRNLVELFIISKSMYDFVVSTHYLNGMMIKLYLQMHDYYAGYQLSYLQGQLKISFSKNPKQRYRQYIQKHRDNKIKVNK